MLRRARWRALARELRARLVLPPPLERAPVLLFGPLALALALRHGLPSLLWGVQRRRRRRQSRRAALLSRFCWSPTAALPLAPARFAAVLVYVPLGRAAARAALVAEARRVLRPGGALVVAQAALPRWRAWARRLRLPVATGLSPERWSALLLNAGFEGIEQHAAPGGHGPLLTSGRRRDHPIVPAA